MRIFLFCALLAASTASFSQIEIEKPWSRATAPGARLAAGYMVVRNKAASADRLIGASSPLAARVETHVTEKEGEILRMRQVKAYDIPARGSFELKPGGAHLMLVDIKQPFKEGDKVPVTLRFEKAGEVKVELPVTRAAPVSGAPQHSH
jgi:copper(I)-binding protein